MPAWWFSLQPHGDILRHRAREVAIAATAAGDAVLALARCAVHPDVEQHAGRDRVLSYPAKPRRRARRPNRDLNRIELRSDLLRTAAEQSSSRRRFYAFLTSGAPITHRIVIFRKLDFGCAH